MKSPEDFAGERERLVSGLRSEIRDSRVLGALSAVPRELFVPEASRSFAYDDRPLPIGCAQTISQPLMVAMMTEALGLKSGHKVLEVGTGSGYQTAVLAELAAWVVSVERMAPLAERARSTLERLGYRNVEVFLAGKVLGWPARAPYDAIVVTAGAPKTPAVLVEQLAVGGRLVVPVGSRYEQQLLRVTRREKGSTVEVLGECRFVPLVGDEAWPEER